MKFIDSIVEKENKCLKALSECRASGYPTYILGAGQVAGIVEARARGFKFEGRLVNRAYYKEVKDTYCLEDFFSTYIGKVNLIVGYRDFNESSLSPYCDKINMLLNYDIWAGNPAVDPDIMTYDFVLEHEADLSAFYDDLSDEYSRTVLSAYINQKIASEWKYLCKTKTAPQYFEDLMPLGTKEVFVDCGAYDGDSAEDFIQALKARGINEWKQIYSFEPDPVNFKKLVARGFCNHTCINKGTSDSAGKLTLSMGGTSSAFDANGDVTVPINTIDDEVHDDVTLIKMDIEGAELASLHGAEQTILKCKPKMAICIYHKKEDLWEIWQYLKSLVPEYKFYVRNYADWCCELVLYAIPSETL